MGPNQAPTVPMKALKDFDYMGKKIKTGDEFLATPSSAPGLVTNGNAEYPPALGQADDYPRKGAKK